MASKHSVLEEVRAAVGKRNSEAGELAAATQVLAKHGSRAKPTISTTRDAKGAAVRIYYWKDSPAGAFALVGGPSFQGKVYTDAELRDTKVPAGFYIEAGAGSDRDDKRVSEILARASKTGGKGGKAVTHHPTHHAPAAPRLPKITGVRSGGRAPYLPGVETVHGRRPPKITGVREAGKAPFRAGQATRYGAAPKPAPSGDVGARVQAALAAVLAQLQAS